MIFDFVNGFHDAANSIATVVATRVLKPWQAVIWAAFWNFIAFAVLPLKVANEIAKIIDSNVVSIGLVFAGLLGAIVWNVVTAVLGLPSSSSHALIGGMVGAGIAKSGGHVVNLDRVKKTAVFIVYSPLLGLLLAFVLIVLVMWLVHRSRNKRARQPNVPQPAAGVGGGVQPRPRRQRRAEDDGDHRRPARRRAQARRQRAQETDAMPLWIVLSCHSAIALGTMFGGWRIVRTMGNKLTRLQPMGGVCAESAAAATLFFASYKGIPVSTTHTITGAIVGVGSADRMSAVQLERRQSSGVGLGVHDPRRGDSWRCCPIGSWRW